MSHILFSQGRGVRFRFDPLEFENIFLQAVKKKRSSAKNLELRLVKSEEMQDLNFRFRGKRKPTDVLSFEVNRNGLLGLIVIDLDTAKKQAREYDHTLLREVQELFVHGIAHLLGYDHETTADAKKMKVFENQLNRLWTRKSKSAKLSTK